MITPWFLFCFNIILLSHIWFCFSFLCLWCFLSRRSLVWLLHCWLLDRLFFPKGRIFLSSIIFFLTWRQCHFCFCLYRLIFRGLDFLFLMRILLFPWNLRCLRLSNLLLTRSALFSLGLYFLLTFWRSRWVRLIRANWLKNIRRGLYRHLPSLPLLSQQGIQEFLVTVTLIEFLIIIIHFRFSETRHDRLLIIVIILLIPCSISIIVLLHIHTLI